MLEKIIVRNFHGKVSWCLPQKERGGMETNVLLYPATVFSNLFCLIKGKSSKIVPKYPGASAHFLHSENPKLSQILPPSYTPKKLETSSIQRPEI